MEEKVESGKEGILNFEFMVDHFQAMARASLAWRPSDVRNSLCQAAVLRRRAMSPGCGCWSGRQIDRNALGNMQVGNPKLIPAKPDKILNALRLRLRRVELEKDACSPASYPI